MTSKIALTNICIHAHENTHFKNNFPNMMAAVKKKNRNKLAGCSSKESQQVEDNLGRLRKSL